MLACYARIIRQVERQRSLHSTVMLTDEDKNVLRKLGINVTKDLPTIMIAYIINKLRQTKTIPALGIVQIEDKSLKTFLVSTDVSELL